MITTSPVQDLEQAKDAIVSLLLGPEFAECLRDEYATQPYKMAIRFPEVGYIDEVRTLDGYPAFELVSGPTELADTNEDGFVHEISLQWTVNGADEEDMSREILRLVKASRVFFSKNGGSLLPFVGGKFYPGRSDTGPTSEGRDQPFVKSASISIEWRAYGL